jgi:hypothetical protein
MSRFRILEIRNSMPLAGSTSAELSDPAIKAETENPDRQHDGASKALRRYWS